MISFYVLTNGFYMISNGWWMVTFSVGLEMFCFPVMKSSFCFANIKFITVPATSFTDDFGPPWLAQVIFVWNARFDAVHVLEYDLEVDERKEVVYTGFQTFCDLVTVVNSYCSKQLLKGKVCLSLHRMRKAPHSPSLIQLNAKRPFCWHQKIFLFLVSLGDVCQRVLSSEALSK